MPFFKTSAWFQRFPFFSTICLETLLQSTVARFFEEDLLAFERKELRDEACPVTIHLEHTAFALGNW